MTCYGQGPNLSNVPMLSYQNEYFYSVQILLRVLLLLLETHYCSLKDAKLNLNQELTLEKKNLSPTFSLFEKFRFFQLCKWNCKLILSNERVVQFDEVI